MSQNFDCCVHFSENAASNSIPNVPWADIYVRDDLYHGPC